MKISLLLQALKLADEVEQLFVKNFAEDDKRKAMKYLRPTQRKESHSVTFFIGELSAKKYLCKIKTLIKNYEISRKENSGLKLSKSCFMITN